MQKVDWRHEIPQTIHSNCFLIVMLMSAYQKITPSDSLTFFVVGTPLKLPNSSRTAF